MVVVDAYSKWIEAFVVNQATSQITIKILSSLFARFGIPQLVVSDNASYFVSEEFKHFLKVTMKNSPPFHPATNGQAENSVKTLKNLLLKAMQTGSADFDIMLNRILFDIRNTQHSTTGMPPAELMFGRKLRGRFDLMLPEREKKPCKNSFPEKVKQNVDKQIKYYMGKRNKHFTRGNIVLVKDYRQQKTSWVKGRVERKIGPRTYLVYIPDINKTWHRHLNQILEYGEMHEHVEPGATTTQMTDSVQIQEGDSLELQDTFLKDKFMEDPVLLNSHSEHNASIRRGLRVRKSPNRLQYK